MALSPTRPGVNCHARTLSTSRCCHTVAPPPSMRMLTGEPFTSTSSTIFARASAPAKTGISFRLKTERAVAPRCFGCWRDGRDADRPLRPRWRLPRSIRQIGLGPIGARSSTAWCCSSPSGSSPCRSASPTCGGSITGASAFRRSRLARRAVVDARARGCLGDGDDRAAGRARAAVPPLVARRVAGDRRDRGVLRVRVGLAQRGRARPVTGASCAPTSRASSASST